MKIVSTTVYQSLNRYASKPVIRMIVDLAALADRSVSHLSDGFVDGLLRKLPELNQPCLNTEKRGDLGRRLREGVYIFLPEIIWRAALAYQRRAGERVGYGATFAPSGAEPHEIVFEYRDVDIGWRAGRLALGLVYHLIPADLRGSGSAPTSFDFTAQGGTINWLNRGRSVDLNTAYLLEAADRRSIPWTRINRQIAVLGQGNRQRHIIAAATDLLSHVDYRMTGDKVVTAHVLEQLGLPAPRQIAVGSQAASVDAAKSIGFPVVVKPRNAQTGRGVSVKLETEDEVAKAYASARSVSRGVIVETFLEGDDHRLLVIDDVMVAAVKRLPAQVIGDGNHNVEELVKIENQARRARGRKAAYDLKLDEISNWHLARAGIKTESIPAKDIVVQLRSASNYSQGGTAHDVTDIVHPDNRALAVRAARAFRMDIAGVDLVITDIARSYREVGGAICEVNSGPGFLLHVAPDEGRPRDVTGPVIDMLIPPGSDGRIPVAAIASTGGGRRAAAILAHMMMLSGRTVGVAMRTGAFVAGQQAGNKGVTSAAAARMVLSDPAVEIAILETRFDEIVQTGVGCDVFSVCAMLDARNRPAQLPDDETYAGLLDRFVTAARDSVVLNADDAKCRQMAKSHPSIRFWYVTENSDNAFVREHVQNGGPACIAQTVEGELSLALYIDGELALAVPAKDIPINASQNERRRIIRQALYATALASCLGADIAGIELGLKTLSHGVLSEPLRAQIVNGPACKLLAGEFREAKVGRHLANILSAMARKDKSIIALLDTDRGVGDTNTGFGLGSPADIDLYVCRDKETKDRLAAAGVSRHRINVAVDEAGVIAHALSAAAPIDIVGVLCDDLDRALQRIDCFRESVIDARNGKPAQLSTDSQTADTEPPLARLTRAAGHSMRTKAVEPAGSLGAAMASEGADTVRSEGQATPAPSQSQAPVATSPASKAEGDKEPLWALPELQTIMGGKWLKRPPEGAVGTGANYYAGQVEPGDVAFTTEPIAWQSSKYRNTNEAIPTLFANGAAAVVASQISAKYEGDQPVLLVDDTRLALDLFGKAARDRLTGKVIAVTGSAGKTTTKEFTHFLLSRQGKTKSSRKNYNHGPGVPLMLAETPPDVRFGVYEFAVDMPKVTAKKAQILRPHVAVITNIYADHLHLYKTLENLADQKCLLFEGLEPGGTTVLNRDSPLFQRLLDNAQKKGVVNVLTFGEAPESQFRLLNAELSVDGSHAVASILDERVEFEVPQPGAYMIMNCLAALAALHAAGGDWRKAVNDVVDLPRLGQRNERYILTFDDGTGELIDDTFSANPASAEAGLSVLKMMRPSPGGRRIAVMGEIKELGENSPKFHAGLAPAVKDAGVDILFTIGADIKPLRDALGPDIPGQHSEDPRAIAVAVAQTLGPGDIVWVKGSRRTPAQLEHIIDTIMDAARETRVLAPSAPDTAASTPRSARAVTEPPPAQPMDAVPTTNYAGPKSPRLLKSGKNGARLEILFLGDTGFGENYQESREARGVENILKTRGYDAPLAELSNLLHSADLVVANLETPVTDLKVSPFAGKKSWVHWADTEKTPTHLLANNIKVVGLANNHTFDYGAAGFDQTLAVLKERGLTAFGAGADLEAAGRPFVIKADMAGRPFELAVIATFETPARKEASHHAYATNRRGGLNPLDATTIGRSIDEVKNALPDALVMVFPHWGQNYKWCTKRQTHLAGELLSAGADVIVGHGAHMVQEIEKQGDRWVVYSLGNFMFNSAGRYAQFNAPPYSLVARLAIEPKGDGMAKRLQLLPIVTDNRITDFRPRPATEAEFDELTTLLKQRFPTPDTFDDMVQRGCDATGHFYLELSL